MILEGTLREFPLRELLELMVFSSVTGALEIQTRHGPGYIYAHMGRVYTAKLGEQSGPPALSLFFEEQDAPFRFIAGETSTEHTLFSDAQTLADEGEERARAWAAIRPRISSMQHVPVLNPLPESGSVQISEDDWPVMAAIDGQRTIKEVAEQALLDPLDACRILVRLLDQHLVQLEGQEPATAEQTWAPVALQTSNGGATSRAMSTKKNSTGLIKRTGSHAFQPEPEIFAEEPEPSENGGGLLSRLLATMPEELISEQQQQLLQQEQEQERQRAAQLEEQSQPPQQPVEPQPQVEQAEDEILRILRGA